MTVPAIRALLEARLLTLGWTASQTAFENVTFTPTTGVAFQQINLIMASPNDYSLGSTTQQRGIFQVTVKEPINAGPGAGDARAEVIAAGFPKNLRLTSGGQLVKIMRTPEITRTGIDGDRDVTVVRIRFSDR